MSKQSTWSDTLLAQDLFTIVLDELFDHRRDHRAGTLNWQTFEYEALTQALGVVLNTSGQYDLVDESRAADGEAYTGEIFQTDLFALLRECPTPALGGDRRPYINAVAKFRRNENIRPQG